MSAATGYVYIKSEPGLFTVGFYDPAGEWHSDSDHDRREDAATRVAFLNGGAVSVDHAVERARVEIEEAALATLRVFITETGGCDHSVNICVCEPVRVADRLHAALEHQLVEVVVKMYVPHSTKDVERLVLEAVTREIDDAPHNSTVHQWDVLNVAERGRSR